MCLFFLCVASPLSGVGCRLQSSKGSRRVKLWINRKWIGRKADKRYTESTSLQQVCFKSCQRQIIHSLYKPLRGSPRLVTFKMNATKSEQDKFESLRFSCSYSTTSTEQLVVWVIGVLTFGVCSLGFRQLHLFTDTLFKPHLNEAVTVAGVVSCLNGAPVFKLGGCTRC